MSTMSIIVTSGINPVPPGDDPSYAYMAVSGSTSSILPDGNYSAYCLNFFAGLSPGFSYTSPTVDSGYTGVAGTDTADYQNLGAYGATFSGSTVVSETVPLNQQQIQEINWIVDQNFTSDAKFGGTYNYSDVQTAIWQVEGLPANYIVENANQPYLGTVNTTASTFIENASISAIANGDASQLPTNATALVQPSLVQDQQALITQVESGKIDGLVWQTPTCSGNSGSTPVSGAQLDNGVTVDLLNSQGKIVETTTTGIDYSSSTQQGGYYEFSGLAAGNYTVQFVAPHGESLTTEAANNVGASTFVPNGNPNTLVSDANQATGDTNTIVLASGQSVDNVDGGLTGHSDCGGLQGGNGNSCGGSPSTGGDNCSNGYPGSGSNSSGGDNCSISSQVWVDNSHCGVETSSDCGLAGITVKIEECINNVFQTIATTTTDNNGCYAFNNLEAGKYEVVAECANGYTYATENTACNGNQANSCVENTGCSGAINLTGGEQYFNANIGLCHTGFFG